MVQVDKCNTIMVFLEKQSTTFLETADQLARMARETLVRATLPNFHLPAAAEILTTGGYTRLPRCIKVPPNMFLCYRISFFSTVYLGYS
jgi:mediator of RNA polymerase II transcription subunit 14